VAALGWHPRYSFDEALEETVRFYSDNPSWWQPLLERVKNR
jgi:dTDP-glucose 4,6-dehydratase